MRSEEALTQFSTIVTLSVTSTWCGYEVPGMMSHNLKAM